uniref:Uncharacterized protein n=1 Tax=Plectus sambesii TaxID=2011161 RepID=A0A914X4G3_9BILA
MADGARKWDRLRYMCHTRLTTASNRRRRRRHPVDVSRAYWCDSFLAKNSAYNPATHLIASDRTTRPLDLATSAVPRRTAARYGNSATEHDLRPSVKGAVATPSEKPPHHQKNLDAGACEDARSVGDRYAPHYEPKTASVVANATKVWVAISTYVFKSAPSPIYSRSINAHLFKS